MFRTMLLAKIHRAAVTATHLHYVGSITIDAALLEASGIRQYEKVQVVDVNNGNRFETYVLAGEAGSGAIELNGASARAAEIGDLLIIMAYALVEEPVSADWEPVVLLMDETNHIVEVRRSEEPGTICC
jgi:aspartate 1-decarboxylase